MNTGKAIKKFLFISVWLMIGGGMVTLLLAAIGKQKKDQCRDYSIIIKTAKQNLFIDEKNVQQLLMAGTGGKIKGQQLSSINLHQLEQLLEENHWIKVLRWTIFFGHISISLLRILHNAMADHCRNIPPKRRRCIFHI